MYGHNLQGKSVDVIRKRYVAMLQAFLLAPYAATLVSNMCSTLLSRHPPHICHSLSFTTWQLCQICDDVTVSTCQRCSRDTLTADHVVIGLVTSLRPKVKRHAGCQWMPGAGFAALLRWWRGSSQDLPRSECCDARVFMVELQMKMRSPIEDSIACVISGIIMTHGCLSSRSGT